MYKIKSKVSSSGSTKEFEIINERFPSVQSRAHLLLLRTRYRKLDPDFYLNGSDKNYKQFIFNREFTIAEKIRLGSLTCCYCGEENLIIARNQKVPKTKMATVDHFYPKSEIYDSFDSDNFVICCSKCNTKKKNDFWDISTLKYIDDVRFNKVKNYVERTKIHNKLK